MNLGALYQAVLACGRRRDPRKRHLPAGYSDTALLHGSLQSAVKKIMVGIDIEAGELLLADRIRQREGLDLVIAHHPEGKAYAQLAGVMDLQADILISLGVRPAVARQMLKARIQEVERRLMPQNHMRAVDVARILDVPFMCIHTPADNYAQWYMQRTLAAAKPQRLADVMELLLAIPEYRIAEKNGSGPRIILGNPRRPAGKMLVEMTGGTEGPKEVYATLAKKGIRTLISMHLGEEHFKKVQEQRLSVIIAGHVSSDTVGLNLLLDDLEARAKEKFHTVDCAGFVRIRRSH